MHFAIIYYVAIIFDLALMLFFAFKKKGEYHMEARLLRRLAVVVTITVSSSVLAILLPSKQIAMFFQTIHYASTEWMLIVLLLFLEYYVGGVRASAKLRIAVFVYAGLSTCSLLCNAIFHHVFDSERVVVNGVEHLYEYYTKAPFYQLHLYFCYLLLVYVVAELLVGLLRTVKLYRKKYLLALIMLLITVGLDALCRVKGFTHDFSLFGYMSLVLFFTYFTLYYLPNDVINKMLSYMVADSHSGAICFDNNDKCVYVNGEIRTLFGGDVSLEFYERKCKEILQVERFFDGKEKKWLQESKHGEKTKHYDITFAKLFDEKGDYTGCYFLVYDRTEDIKRYRQERYKATHDSLTNLHNRDYFYEKILDMKKENPDVTYYIVCTDIKDFKMINDLFGYEMGNEILRRFGYNLKQSLPKNVIIARLVSDRFAFCIEKEMFRGNYLVDCLNDAQSLLRTREYQLHMHAGVYEVQPEDMDVSLMCDRAALAIRTVKNDYDVMIAYYDDVLMNKMKNSKRMINEFDYALENHQFVMFLQPQVDTDGTVLGAEALTRWIHPEKGMISPGEFIPVFEDAGLIHRLDQYIWEQAACKLKEWSERGRGDMHISVNISTKDFYYIDIFKEFTNLVEKYEIRPQQLKLEITESVLMRDTDKQLELISRLQGYGFHVEIDDFGSGYSSLNMLQNFRADVLKIDMGFLQKIQDQERTRIILDMIVNLAKRLQMVVISEGVETQNQVEYLKEMGCDMFQGFYFARPIAVCDFEDQYMK